MLSKSMNQEEVLISPRNTKKTTHSSSSPSKNSGFVSFCKKLTRKRAKGEEELSRLTSSSSSSSSVENGSCYERVFAYFDEDGDGRVSAAELQRAVRAVGGELTAEEAEEAVRLSDSDGDGMLGIEDFTKLMEGEKKEDELREAFGMYAMKGTDYITPKSLKKMLGRLGESTTTHNCKAMIRRFDLNGDGVLGFDEFKIMMS
nr:putative calcium-binding protein CML19 [Ipomoea batatas]GMD74089.1 putative calcium-binding protein CML19 [Ipomoea batatas]GMD85310.1 putative calcium-binding protein CML19 [Ipomoea batatas]GMD91938.1 putative calcium-binding protein CML19 [Ipomoea batatas]GME06516.1 putative calcium-binding protein CML19 [Ipomoea batatas]